jgi:peptide/nickel transport system ATP-binding protein
MMQIDGVTDSTVEPLLAVKDLRIEFRGKERTVVAVPRLSFNVRPGESYGLVGESGCGKSTTAMAIMGYLGSTGAVAGGSIRYKGQDLVGASGRQMRALRGREIAMVYQDPMSALNPVKTIGAQLAEVPLLHLGTNRSEAMDMAAAMLGDVRLPDPGEMLRRYPHQLSGGQQQRVAIGRVIVDRPKVILADEPTGALDSRTSVEVMHLFQELWKTGITVVLVTHEPDIAEHASRVIVMRDGRILSDRRQEPKLAAAPSGAAA